MKITIEVNSCGECPYFVDTGMLGMFYCDVECGPDPIRNEAIIDPDCPFLKQEKKMRGIS